MPVALSRPIPTERFTVLSPSAWSNPFCFQYSFSSPQPCGFTGCSLHSCPTPYLHQPRHQPQQVWTKHSNFPGTMAHWAGPAPGHGSGHLAVGPAPLSWLPVGPAVPVEQRQTGGRSCSGWLRGSAGAQLPPVSPCMGCVGRAAQGSPGHVSPSIRGCSPRHSGPGSAAALPVPPGVAATAGSTGLVTLLPA